MHFVTFLRKLTGMSTDLIIPAIQSEIKSCAVACSETKYRHQADAPTRVSHSTRRRAAIRFCRPVPVVGRQGVSPRLISRNRAAA